MTHYWEDGFMTHYGEDGIMTHHREDGIMTHYRGFMRHKNQFPKIGEEGKRSQF